MNPPLSSEAGAQAVTTLSQDTPCRKCGYNLRGLSSDGCCPECGTPVGLSLREPLLRYCDPQWVASLARGVNLILWGFVLSFAVAFVLGFLAGSLGLKPSVWTASVAWIGALVGLYGTWLLTCPDPSGIGEDQYGTIRRITRFAVVVGLIGGTLNIIAQSSRLPATLTLLLGIVVSVGTLVGWVGEFCKFWFMEKLCLRIPEQALARRARFLRWAMTTIGIMFTLCFGLVGVLVWATPGAGTAGTAVAPVASAPAGGSAAVVNVGGVVFKAQAGPGSALAFLLPAVGCFAVLMVLAALILSVVAVHMQWRLRNALREQARYARRTWAAVSASPGPPPPPPARV